MIEFLLIEYKNHLRVGTFMCKSVLYSVCKCEACVRMCTHVYTRKFTHTYSNTYAQSNPQSHMYLWNKNLLISKCQLLSKIYMPAFWILLPI